MSEFPKQVLVTFWECSKGHRRHQTREAAQRCTDHARSAPKKAAERKAWMRDRRKKALALRREGLKLREIAARLESRHPPGHIISVDRVSQLIRAAEREERREAWKERERESAPD